MLICICVLPSLNRKPLEEGLFPNFHCKCQMDVLMSWSRAIFHLACSADSSLPPVRTRTETALRVPAQGLAGTPEGREPSPQQHTILSQLPALLVMTGMNYERHLSWNKILIASEIRRNF